MAVYDNHLPYEEKECNTRIVREIATDLRLNISQVEDITKHFSQYINNTIHSGGLEGVMVPYLGKFQVKLHSQQYKDFLHTLGPVMKRYFKSNKDAMKTLIEEAEAV